MKFFCLEYYNRGNTYICVTEKVQRQTENTINNPGVKPKTTRMRVFEAAALSTTAQRRYIKIRNLKN